MANPLETEAAPAYTMAREETHKAPWEKYIKIAMRMLGILAIISGVVIAVVALLYYWKLPWSAITSASAIIGVIVVIVSLFSAAGWKFLTYKFTSSETMVPPLPKAAEEKIKELIKQELNKIEEGVDWQQKFVEKERKFRELEQQPDSVKTIHATPDFPLTDGGWRGSVGFTRWVIELIRLSREGLACASNTVLATCC